MLEALGMNAAGAAIDNTMVNSWRNTREKTNKMARGINGKAIRNR